MNFKTEKSRQRLLAVDNKTIASGLVHLAFVSFALCALAGVAVSEYENTWNFYYEQPCCSSSNGHHLRHHRGKH